MDALIGAVIVIIVWIYFSIPDEPKPDRGAIDPKVLDELRKRRPKNQKRSDQAR